MLINKDAGVDETELFWRNIPAWAKWDELSEIKHLPLLQRVLEDPETGAEEFDRDEYILYGPEEALLFRPKGLLPRLAMTLYEAMLDLFGRN